MIKLGGVEMLERRSQFCVHAEVICLRSWMAVWQSGLRDFMDEFISKQNPGVAKVKVKQATSTESFYLEKTLDIIKSNH